MDTVAKLCDRYGVDMAHARHVAAMTRQLLEAARAFWNPAAQSLAPNLVPPEALANAITTNMSAWQFASIAGPAAGGLLYGISPSVAFGTAAALLVVLPLKGRPLGGGWHLNLLVTAVLINGAWGIGTGLILRSLPERFGGMCSYGR